MDWIKARAECNPQRMFECLAERLTSDYEEWGKLAKRPIEADVKLILDGAATIRITWTSKLPPEPRDGTYSVSLIDNRIRYRSNVGKEAFFSPSLNAGAKCLFLHDGFERELWEVSRYILEPLLF
jgi:hypothetical protein